MSPKGCHWFESSEWDRAAPGSSCVQIDSVDGKTDEVHVGYRRNRTTATRGSWFNESGFELWCP